MRTLHTIAAATLLTMLAACGGGGGGSSSPAADPVVPTVPAVDAVSTAGTLQTSVTPATYTFGSQERAGYAKLNALRLAAGAGVLAQSTLLDTAASHHAQYITANIADGLVHNEISGRVGFYGVTPAARISNAGFAAGFSTEVIGGTGASNNAEDCMLGMLNTVYHAAALLSQTTHVGVGMGTDAANTPVCVANLATASGDANAQVAAAGSMVAYPHAGQTGVADTFYVGYESPRPSAALFPNLTAGTPVVVNVRNAEYVNAEVAGTLNVNVTTFRLTDAGGNTVPAGILASGSISGTGLTADANLGSGFVVLVPLSPLAKGVTYTATFTATLKAGGPVLTKTWSFTTTN